MTTYENGFDALTSGGFLTTYIRTSQVTGIPSGAQIVSVTIEVGTAAGNIRYSVYADDGSGGGPGTLLGESNSVPVVSGKNYIALNSPATVPASGKVWVAHEVDSDSVTFKYTAASGAGYYLSPQSYGSAPNPYPLGGSTFLTLSAFCGVKTKVTNNLTSTVDIIVTTPTSLNPILDLIVLANQTNTFSLDTIIEAHISSLLDLLVETTGNTKTFSIDLEIAIDSQTIIRTLDLLVLAHQSKTFTLDLSIPSTMTTLLDLIVVSRPNISPKMDLIVKASQTKTTLLDLLVGLFGSKTLSLDLIVTANNTKISTFDIIISKTGSISPSMDMIVKVSGITINKTLDLIVVNKNNMSMSIDLIIPQNHIIRNTLRARQKVRDTLKAKPHVKDTLKSRKKTRDTLRARQKVRDTLTSH